MIRQIFGLTSNIYISYAMVIVLVCMEIYHKRLCEYRRYLQNTIVTKYHVFTTNRSLVIINLLCIPNHVTQDHNQRRHKNSRISWLMYHLKEEWKIPGNHVRYAPWSYVMKLFSVYYKEIHFYLQLEISNSTIYLTREREREREREKERKRERMVPVS